jgi:hypothetical protein
MTTSREQATLSQNQAYFELNRPRKWGTYSQHLSYLEHLISALSGTSIKAGMGSDAPDFHDLLYEAWCRHDVREVLVDAG